MQEIQEIQQSIYNGNTLSIEESARIFGALVRGELSTEEITALLVALKVRGETPEEIAGAALALRSSAKPFPTVGRPLADCCGTGGDGHHTINVSTAAAFVLAELGVPVAKHGNRSVSSKSGSADVLEKLGIRIEQSPSLAARCLAELGICFLFAPSYHLGMRFAMPARKVLATRTIFNLLGPLVNPARPEVQIVGVYDPSLTVPLARALSRLGVQSALVVHGAGLDEIAIHGKTVAALLREQMVEELEIDPRQLGIENFPIEELKGGDPEENAQVVAQILKGEGRRAHHLSVAINAGAAAWLYGKTSSLEEGYHSALQAIESGECYRRLLAFQEMSHGA